MKILFLIHDLGRGGAEKVLVNLVNNLDREAFDVTVIALFGGGVNEQFLDGRVKFRTVFPRSIPGNSRLMKLLSPRALHRMIVKEHYDVEVSYLEGPCARIISGCEDPDTKLVSWIHCTMKSPEEVGSGFRSAAEARACYGRMHRLAFVSRSVRDAFVRYCPHPETRVLYNTIESDAIRALAHEEVSLDSDGRTRLTAVGTLKKVKGLDRLVRIAARLKTEGYPVRLYLLGEGPEREALARQIAEGGLQEDVILAGYQVNPYRYVARCDLLVCSSYSEGLSTAVTEALIVGTPVCTVEVSGMRELLGENDEFGVVTENDEEALYRGIRRLLDDPALMARYREKAAERGRAFSKEETVGAVQEMLTEMCREDRR